MGVGQVVDHPRADRLADVGDAGRPLPRSQADGALQDPGAVAVAQVDAIAQVLRVGAPDQSPLRTSLDRA